jgi:multicomponent Na+:H+ antiporter subunit E
MSPHANPPPARPSPGLRARSRAALRLTLVLFGFWVLLSGKLDAPHLALGALCAAGVAAATLPLLALPPAIGPGVSSPVPLALVGRFALYQLWLLREIVVGSLQVAWVVLHPRLPIEPRLLRLRASLPHPLARLVLANSITLTPGTATLDVDGDSFVVHALTDASARGLGPGGGGGEMARRVRAVFEPAAERA